MPKDKNILLIAYHFPPIRVSSGLQRTLSLAKYLKENSWLPSVLSISPSAYEAVSQDQLKDIPDYVEVVRAKGWNTEKLFSKLGGYPSFLALPDRWISWLFGGVIAGRKVIKQKQISVIWSTFPIATAHFIGLVLNRLSGVTWVADFRDSMVEDDYPVDEKQRKVYLWLEKKVIARATKVVFTTEGARQMYIERYPDIDPERFAVIPNGYDEEAFKKAEQLVSKDKPKSRVLRLTHSGIIYPTERDPTALFDALSELKKGGQINADTLQIILRASVHDHLFEPMLKSREIQDIVKLEPSVGYAEALAEMLESDALLLFQASNCNHQIPAKLYEYFRARKPIFALTDKRGNTAEALRMAGISTIVELNDKSEIKQGLIQLMEQVGEGSAPVASSSIAEQYSRRSLAKTYSKILDSVYNSA